MTRHEGDHDRAYRVGPDGAMHPLEELNARGDLGTAASIDGGAALIAVLHLGSRSELWRLEPTRDGVHPARRLLEVPHVGIVAASRDGGVVLLRAGGTTSDALSLYRAGHALPLTPLEDFRYFAGGDVSEDGMHVALSGIPPSCTDSPMSRCRLEVHLYDLTHEPPASQTLGQAPHSTYRPRFSRPSGGAPLVYYQTTESDVSEACLHTVNQCRHDIVARDLAGALPPRLVQANALGFEIAPRGTEVSYLSYADPETGCTGLPCSRLSLYVGPSGGVAQRRVTAGVSSFTGQAWSPDDRAFVYVGEAPGTSSQRATHVQSLDGSLDRALGDVRPVAWYRH